MTEIIYTETPDKLHTPDFYYYLLGEDSNIKGIASQNKLAALMAVFTHQTPLTSGYTKYIQQEIKNCVKGTGYRWWIALERKSVKYARDRSRENLDRYGKEILRLARYLELDKFEAILVDANKRFLEAHRVH